VSSLPAQVRLRRDSVCTACSPSSFLSTYIVCRQRLVEARLVLLRDDEDVDPSAANRSGSCRSGKPFMPGSVNSPPPSRTGAREGHRRLDVAVALLLQVAVELLLCSGHRVQRARSPPSPWPGRRSSCS
jgi:hypothetical protein